MKRKTILFIFLFLLLTSPILAQEKTTVSAEVKYELANPGMLPDSPLYKLKVLKDKISLKLKRDPITKAEHHLLLADKRIHMAKILVEKNEIELAKETALKGENEYTLLINQLKSSRKKPSKELYEKLKKASLKHQEVLTEISSKTKGEDKKIFEIVIGFSKTNLEELEKIYKYY